MIEDVLPEKQFSFILLPANFHFACLVSFALGSAPPPVLVSACKCPCIVLGWWMEAGGIGNYS